MSDYDDALDRAMEDHIEEKHEPFTESLLPAACALGECDHADECPPIDVEVCPGCTEYDEEGERVWYTPWTVAEARGHALANVGKES